jgi:hypothetical protein
MSLIIISDIVSSLVLLGCMVLALCLFDEQIRVSRGGVPFVPSTTAVIQTVIDANVLPKEGMILDLGCGNGKALRMLEGAGYKGPLIGYEHAPGVWLRAKIWGMFKKTNAEVRRKNFNEAPLEEAKGLYLFLYQHVLKEMAPMLRSRLKSGTIVVSAEFPIADWVPEQTFEAKGITSRKAKIFVYKM